MHSDSSAPRPTVPAFGRRLLRIRLGNRLRESLRDPLGSLWFLGWLGFLLLVAANIVHQAVLGLADKLGGPTDSAAAVTLALLMHVALFHGLAQEGREGQRPWIRVLPLADAASRLLLRAFGALALCLLAYLASMDGGAWSSWASLLLLPAALRLGFFLPAGLVGRGWLPLALYLLPLSGSAHAEAARLLFVLAPLFLLLPAARQDPPARGRPRPFVRRLRAWDRLHPLFLAAGVLLAPLPLALLAGFAWHRLLLGPCLTKAGAAVRVTRVLPLSWGRFLQGQVLEIARRLWPVPGLLLVMLLLRDGMYSLPWLLLLPADALLLLSLRLALPDSPRLRELLGGILVALALFCALLLPPLLGPLLLLLGLLLYTAARHSRERSAW